MKTNLKNKLQDLISSYKADAATFETNYRKELEHFNDPDVKGCYSEAGLYDLTNEKAVELKDDWKAVCTTYNQKAKAIVEDAKESIVTAVVGTPSRPGDYATRIANALNFLDRETAESLNDDVAHAILKDFISDYEQMGLFKRVIENKVGPGLVDADNGTSEYSKTFGPYAKADQLLQMFREIDSIVDAIFVHPKFPGAGADELGAVRVGGRYYEIPMDGYTEIANWDTLVELADSVDQHDPKSDD